ncbi:MAG TPA: DUF3090 domain-containing protein [Mycobacteriales bacterium]|nr:DUF3090 domain-containing protein [Mycobacteriales bacterium]
MAGREFAFDPPDRFVAGTVGQPGERTFYLQATRAGQTVSVVLEKMQVSALAERLDDLLDEVRRRQGSESAVPPAAPPQLEDVAPLEVPIEEEFRVGTLALAWDDDDSLVIIEAQSVVDTDTDAEEGTPSDVDTQADMLRVRLSPAVARAFAKRALRVVAAGRPPCPLCGNPLDPQGHICPRQNGHLHASA